MASKISLCSAFVLLLCVAVFAEDDSPGEEKRSIADTMFAMNFLKSFHYLSSLKSGNHNWKKAIRLYQEFSQLPVTGKLDDSTIKEMHKPRCGVPDINEGDENGISKRFFTTAKHWPSPSFTYGFHDYCMNLPKQKCMDIIAEAFKIWSENTVLSFTLTDVSKAQLKLRFNHSSCGIPFDGKDGTLAHASYPFSGEIHFDDEVFVENPKQGEYSLLSVAAHEIGHAIGIVHTTIRDAIMHNEYKELVNRKLHWDELNAVAYLFGNLDGSPAIVMPQATQAADCFDEHSQCLKHKYLCNSMPAMKQYCAMTCGHCTPNGQITACKDTFTASWCQALQGQCNYPSVQAGCKKTCNKCGS